MARRILAALFAALFAAPALAQVPTTLPPNSVLGRTAPNAGPAQAIPIAALNGLLNPIARVVTNVTPVISGTSGGFLLNFNGTVSNTDAVGCCNLLSSGTISIAPPANDTRRGLNILQTLPSTGTLAGAVYSNLIQGSLNTVVAASIDPDTGLPGAPGTRYAPNWSLFQISASVGSNYDATGGIDVGQAYGLSVGMVVNGDLTTTSDIVGASFGTSNGFANPNARMYGAVTSATATASGAAKVLIGLEVGVAQNNATLARVPVRYGINIDNYGTHTANGMDTALSIQGGNIGGGWKRGITFTNPGGALEPALQTTGTMLSSEVAMTVDTGFDFSNVTFNSYILNAQYIKMSRSALALGTSSLAGSWSIDGPASSAVFSTFKSNGTAIWTIGSTTINDFAIGDPQNSRTPISVAKTDGLTTIGNSLAVTGTITGTSSSASALTVGLNGATNPAFTVDASTGSQAAGFKITGAATGGTVTLVATDSGSNTNVTLNAKGSGTIGVGSVSTGRVTITPATTITGALTLSAVGLVYDGKTLTGSTGTGKMVLDTTPTLVTPVLGVATATTINKVALTAPASSATLTIADGKTATHNASTTFAGTDGKTLTVSNSGTLSGGDAWTLAIAASKTLTASGSMTLAPTDGVTLTMPTSTSIGSGQYQGTNTNDSATAGNIGEYRSANCPGTASTATVTITIASPGVITWTAHPFVNDGNGRADACPVIFTTSSSLPTGITAGTTYYVVPSTIATNTFQIATTVANALAGTSINTSGSQAGTQTGTAGKGLSTGTAADVTGVSLTAGDWTCSGNVAYNAGGTTVTSITDAWVASTSATLATYPNSGASSGWVGSATGFVKPLLAGTIRMLLSSTTTVYLGSLNTFSTSTLGALGFIGCRRMR